MRVKVSLLKSSPCTGLNLNYNYHLASAIYSKFGLVDIAKSKKLHDLKKFFTFSRLFVPERQIKGDKLIFKGKRAYFYFSSPSKDDVTLLIEGLLSEPEMELQGVKFIVDEIKILKEDVKSGDVLKTISPITVFVKKDGKRYFPPATDATFSEAIKRRLYDRFLKYYGRTPESDAFTIEITKMKEKLIYVSKTPYKAYDLIFRVWGNEELIKFGYQAGFGKKNSMGFGMIEKVRTRDKY